jgi:hypothetical protein
MHLSDHLLDPKSLLKVLEHQVDQLAVDSYRLVSVIKIGKREIVRGIESAKERGRGREIGIENQFRRGLLLE